MVSAKPNNKTEEFMEKCVGIVYWKPMTFGFYGDDSTRFAAEQCAKKARASDPEGCYTVSTVQQCFMSGTCSDAGHIVHKSDASECENAEPETICESESVEKNSCVDITFSKLPSSWFALGAYGDEDTKAEAQQCADSMNANDPLKRYTISELQGGRIEGPTSLAGHSVSISDEHCDLNQKTIDFGSDRYAAESCLKRIHEMTGDSAYQLRQIVRTFLGIDWLAADHYQIVRE